MKPKLTILITSYNKEKYISYVINMLIAQNCEDIVVHIIDDGSTDNSLNIINYASWSRWIIWNWS